MQPHTDRRIRVTPPALTGPDVQLAQIASLDAGRGLLHGFHCVGAELRDLELDQAYLTTGRVTGLRSTRTDFTGVRTDSLAFEDCALGTLQWSKGKLSRSAFRGCKLMGAAFTDVTVDNVLFENCRLDYTAFTRLRTAGRLVFSRCVLTEASFTGCDLRHAVFDDCTLRLTEFGRGYYRNCDLRGNDLSTLLGVHRLEEVIINSGQQFQLAEALVAALEVTFGEDLDDEH
ncbi:pentapeptide repeat-containing protein [Streptomyces beijiangensis]|uniref:Pentapeptide repeat-containing protein n=1 Tax=Streptomyces beijiangensis TaxID=163361 RepID=A0A939JJ69_9ACTN|nr:pentapeptide repeat-containing protein [Streptomyces beijiangensis]